MKPMLHGSMITYKNRFETCRMLVTEIARGKPGHVFNSEKCTIIIIIIVIAKYYNKSVHRRHLPVCKMCVRRTSRSRFSNYFSAAFGTILVAVVQPEILDSIPRRTSAPGQRLRFRFAYRPITITPITPPPNRNGRYWFDFRFSHL